MRIDPHTHSTFSDGTDTPAELLVKASRAGLQVLGLTDHDTSVHLQAPATPGAFDPARPLSPWAENFGQALRAAGGLQAEIAVLPGVEISCDAPAEVGVHLLAYLPDLSRGHLQAIFDRAQETRRERLEAMIDLLSRDFPLHREQVWSKVAPGATPGRPHLADALVENGAFVDRSQAFAQVLHKRSSYYVPRWSPTIFEGIAATRADGGVPIIAHPFAARKGNKLSPDLFGDLVEAGLAGMEIWHRDHSAEERQLAAQLCEKYGLLASGSSDYHGRGKPNELGENLMPQATFEGILTQGASSLLTLRP